ncbi:putative DNA helicase [Vibrio phage V-YDF132]|nr:putative DNA helicase [Vibrio phage V-YDF132]
MIDTRLKSYHRVSRPPKSLKYGGVYWATKNMMERFTVETRHTQDKKLPPLELFKRIGGEKDDHERILIPRACCPIPQNDNRSRGAKCHYDCTVVPRDKDQISFMQQARALVKNGESFIAEAPTGFGKTVVTMDTIAAAETTVLILVHKEDLETQWRKSLKEQLNLKDHEIGLIKGDIVRVRGRKVVIGYIQSLYKEGRYPPYIYDYFGLVVADEVHIMGAMEFSKVAWLFSAYLWIGLSATPYRKDGNDIIFHAHIGEVKIRIKKVSLSPKVIVGYSSFKIPMTYKWDATEGRKVRVQVPHKAGKIGHITKLMHEDESRNDMICEFVSTAYTVDRRILILADTKKQLQALEECLHSWGVKRSDIAYYIGGMSEAAREKAKTKPVCLATYQMCSTGTDNPIWDTCVLATPRADVNQIVGRVLRVHERKCSVHKPEEGKKCPVVLDVLDADSKVFLGYFKARQKYYTQVNAVVVM